MVKKQNNNAWIIYLIALIAIAALVLGAIAIHRVNMTGKGIFDFWKNRNLEVNVPDSPGENYGFLGKFYLDNGGKINDLKGYSVSHGPDGIVEWEVRNGICEGNCEEWISLGDGSQGCKKANEVCERSSECCSGLSCAQKSNDPFARCKGPDTAIE